MEKYKINGELKSEEGQEHDCKTCKNGKIYENNIYLKTDELETSHAEPICDVCLTKYKIEKETLAVSIPEDYKPSSREFMTRTEAIFMLEDVYEKMEEKKMDYSKELESFNTTGICPGHIMVKSNNVKTAEGQFVFDTCIVCKEATVEHDGKLYKGKINELVNWIAQKGINFDNKISTTIKIEDLGEAECPDVSFDDLFKVDDIKEEECLFD